MTEVNCSDAAFEFIGSLLEQDPQRRMTLTHALAHRWLCPTYSNGTPIFLGPDSESSQASSLDSSQLSLRRDSVGVKEGTPMSTGVSEDFHHLDLESDLGGSPAVIDWNDVQLGGPSRLTRSIDLAYEVENREKSWDLMDTEGDRRDGAVDPEQTPLARPRKRLLDDDPTARPPVNQPVISASLSQQRKRKLSSDEDDDVSSSSHEDVSRGNKAFSPRKAGKVNESDTPAGKARSFSARPIPSGRRGQQPRNGKGKGPIPRDFAAGDE